MRLSAMRRSTIHCACAGVTATVLLFSIRSPSPRQWYIARRRMAEAPWEMELVASRYQLLTWIVTVAEAGGSGGGVFVGLVTRSVTVSVPVLAFAE